MPTVTVVSKPTAGCEHALRSCRYGVGGQRLNTVTWQTFFEHQEGRRTWRRAISISVSGASGHAQAEGGSLLVTLAGSVTVSFVKGHTVADRPSSNPCNPAPDAPSQHRATRVSASAKRRRGRTRGRSGRRTRTAPPCRGPSWPRRRCSAWGGWAGAPCRHARPLEVAETWVPPPWLPHARPTAHPPSAAAPCPAPGTVTGFRP